MDEITRTRFINNIISESQRLGGLVDDILDISSLKAEKMNFDFQPNCIDTIINCAIQSMSGALPANMKITYSKTGINVFADKKRLIQTLIKLYFL